MTIHICKSCGKELQCNSDPCLDKDDSFLCAKCINKSLTDSQQSEGVKK